MLSQEVTTKDGNVKMVMADSEEELAEAVKVAKGDQLAASPDINNPAHGNVIVDQFVADEPVAPKPKTVKPKVEVPKTEVKVVDETEKKEKVLDNKDQNAI